MGENDITDERELLKCCGVVLEFMRKHFADLTEMEKVVVLKSATGVLETIAGAKSLALMMASYAKKG